MITVVCPVYNEADNIRNVIEFFIDAAPTEKELIIIDGGSTDSTCDIVKEYAAIRNDIRLMDNPDKYVPFALNMAIRNSNGNPVIRLDAHTVYEYDYFTCILETFTKSGADIVGGPMRAFGGSNFQQAVAIATSTSLGVGNSSFHDSTHEGFVESVYLGAWKREVFNDIGLFDTDMLRNQDDEFHYRANQAGKKIYLSPGIKSLYSPRNSLISLTRQYFQYGLFKPLVLKKVNSGFRFRHIIPALFVLYLLTLIIINNSFLLTPLALYFLIVTSFSFTRQVPFAVNWRLLFIYPALHLSYGVGFIIGIFTLVAGKKPSI
jgi:succinoglycan biosynthesis protein ExoA